MRGGLPHCDCKHCNVINYIFVISKTKTIEVAMQTHSCYQKYCRQQLFIFFPLFSGSEDGRWILFFLLILF